MAKWYKLNTVILRDQARGIFSEQEYSIICLQLLAGNRNLQAKDTDNHHDEMPSPWGHSYH